MNNNINITKITGIVTSEVNYSDYGNMYFQITLHNEAIVNVTIQHQHLVDEHSRFAPGVSLLIAGELHTGRIIINDISHGALILDEPENVRIMNDSVIALRNNARKYMH